MGINIFVGYNHFCISIHTFTNADNSPPRDQLSLEPSNSVDYFAVTNQVESANL